MPFSWIPLLASLLAAEPTPTATPNLVPTVSSGAPNAHLERARQHLDALAFREASEELDLALDEPGNDREVLLEILSLRGVTAAAMENLDVGGASFRKLLCLDPGHELPRDYSPKIRNLFDEARAWQQEQGASSFEPEPTAVTDLLKVRVTRDPLQMARRVRFHFEAGAVRTLMVGGELRDGVSEVEIPRAASSGWWAELLGDRDAVLLRLGSESAPLPFARPRSAPSLAVNASPRSQSGSPPGLRWTAIGLWTAGGASLAAGAVLGVRSSNARGRVTDAERDGHGRIVGMTQAQADALVLQSQRDGLTANVLFGATVGLAIAGGGLWLWNQRVTVAPEPGGVAVGGTWP